MFVFESEAYIRCMSQSASSMHSENQSPTRSGKRMLVFEDDLLQIRALMYLLRKYWPGCEITVVRNRAESIEVVRKSAMTDFDMVWIDYQLEDASILGLAKEFSDFFFVKDKPPMLLCTSLADEEIIAECKKHCAFDGFIPKPMRPEDIEAIAARFPNE